MNAIKETFLLRAPVVLISGETGCGKSYYAKQIYIQSTIGKEQFVTVHLAALSESLIESELFGHEKGSFTGATQTKVGYFEKCGDGTLFLDEIGELSLEAQKKLLYLLEERRYSPVGSTQEKIFRGRIIAATNCNLPELVHQGKFRQDLYYRLLLAQFEIRPLRDRREDFHHLLEEINHSLAEKYKVKKMALGCGFSQWGMSYSWPGNIREMKNLLEYFYLRGEEVAELSKLPRWIAKQDKEKGSCSLDYTQGLEKFEDTFFRQALEHFNGKINETARQIGISKSTLIAKVRKYGINTWDIKSRHFSSAQGYA